jgi:hypothetical protein
MAWAERGFRGEAPPPMDPTAPGAAKMLRMQFAAARAEAEKCDAQTSRRLGKLPKPGSG